MTKFNMTGGQTFFEKKFLLLLIFFFIYFLIFLFFIYLFLFFELASNYNMHSSVHTVSTSHAHTNQALHWRHNGRDSVSNHQPHDCLFNGLFRRRSKKTWKHRVTVRGPVNSPHKWPVTLKMFTFDDVIMFVEHTDLQTCIDCCTYVSWGRNYFKVCQ